MTRKEENHTFQQGLIMDMNPLIVEAGYYTNALNATFVTKSGNNAVLQQDMGNGRVETAYLPEGYVPLGTTQLGGIIYIVSYNPLTDRCQIGSFPSPERNISSDELSTNKKSLSLSTFYNEVEEDGNKVYYIKAPSQKVILTDDNLNPGDKFIVQSSEVGNVAIDDSCIDENYISACVQELNSPDAKLYPKYLKLSLVSLQDNGKVATLNDSLTWYDYSTLSGDNGYYSATENTGYYIYPATISEDGSTVSVDEYRNIVSSNYSVFQSKVSGKLAVLAELEVIDSFEVAWDAQKESVTVTNSDDTETEEDRWVFYFFLNWTYSNSKAPDKINLYGIKVNTTLVEEQEDGTYEASGETMYGNEIVITNYPKSIAINDNTDSEEIISKLTEISDLVTSSDTITVATKENINTLLSIDSDSNDDTIASAKSTSVTSSSTYIQDYTNDALTNQYTTFYTPCYVKNYAAYVNTNGIQNIYTITYDSDGNYTITSESIDAEDSYTYNNNNNGITTARYNDGTDNQFLCTTGFVCSETEGIVQFDVYPTMPFGIIQYLKETLTINLDLLGSGEISLKEYRYYWSEYSITLQWALSAYPELNKTINSVTFNFYEWSSYVKAFCSSNSNYIDSAYVVTQDVGNGVSSQDAVWYYETTTTDDDGNEITEEATATVDYNGLVIYLGNNTPVSITTSSKSSYSGNFTEIIENKLNNNSLYLVEIVINYNDEKEIRYYRFMYTSAIFNQYYLSSGYSDFAEIQLQDALNNYYPITVSTSNIKSSLSKEETLYEVITDDDGNETLSVIDSVYTNKTEAEKVTYQLDTLYDDCNVTFDISIYNEIFSEISINSIESSYDEISNDSNNDNYDSTSSYITSTNNAEEQKTYQSSTTNSNINELDDVEQITTLFDISLSETIGSFSFTTNLLTDIIADYSYSSVIAVEYELTPLKICHRDIWIREKSTFGSMWISSSFKDDSIGGNIHGDSCTDERVIFPGPEDVGNEIESLLKSYDVIIVKMYRLVKHSDDAKQLQYFLSNTTSLSSGSYAGYNSNATIGTTEASKKLYKNSSESNPLPVFIGYIINTNDGYKYMIPRWRGGSGTNWYGCDLITANINPGYAESPVVYYYANSSQGSINDYLEVPFTWYYKIQSCNDTTTLYIYNSISYYNNYTWQITFNIPCKVEYLISINGISIDTNSNINNLYYTGTLNTTLTGTIEDVIYISNYVDNILSTPNTAVIDAEGNYYLDKTDVSATNLYDKNFNILKSYIYPTGDEANDYINNPKYTSLISDYTMKIDKSTGLLYFSNPPSIVKLFKHKYEGQSWYFSNLVSLY